MNTVLERVSQSRLTARARMTGALAQVAAGRDPATVPLRAALRTAALGAIPPAERAWTARIESHRNRLLEDSTPSFGPFSPTAPADGDTGGEGRGTVAGASAMMSLQAPWCSLLMRLARELEPHSCLELGTGFGISGAYLAAALELNRAGHLTTVEGRTEWAAVARRGFAALGLRRVECRVGAIADLLAAEAARVGPVDLAFVDAEHEPEATVAYFETLAPAFADGAHVVFDDVSWSQMRPAFAAIARDARVRASVVVGRLGIVILDTGTARS